MSEREQLEQAIAHLESQRTTLGDAVVDASIAALQEKLAAMQPTQAEEQRRRQVTVLFSDISGFTAMSELMDAEEVGNMMNDLWHQLDQIIIHRGGRIDKHLGDGVMAVWGTESAREDDPEQAIRAALNMQVGMATFCQQQDVKLAMRSGINTGPVLLSRIGTTEEYTAIGDTVNLASRLEEVAPIGGVLISHDTYRHVRGIFDVQPLPPVQIKGKRDLVQVYRIQRAKPRAFRMGTRGVEGIETRMIGRGLELEQLQQTFLEIQDCSRCRIVTILGEAGMGKSRLLFEFENWLELQPQQIRYFKGRASPEMQYLPYALIREMFASHFQIQESDTQHIVRQKIEQGFAEVVDSPEAIPRAHITGHLLGFDFSDSPHLQGITQQDGAIDPQQLHDRALVHLVDYFEMLASQMCTILLLEDLHWADTSSLDLIKELARARIDQRFLILCLARPSLLERRPNWIDFPQGTSALSSVDRVDDSSAEYLPHLRLDLPPLSKNDSRDLVEEILQRVQEVPDALRELVVSGAEGNPFYIEELIKMLIEDGVILKGAEYWQVDPTRLTTVRVPSTLTGVIQARLDSLPREERIVLQQASVVGRTFWDSAVARISQAVEKGVSEQEILETLLALREREMIFPRLQSAFAATHEYIFKHAILRQVTYESVLKRVRRVYHALVAEWLIEHSGERIGEYLGLIADHMEMAGQTEQAIDYLGMAGERAATQFANSEAVRYLSRALDLIQGDSPEHIAQRYDLLLIRERVYSLQGKRKAQMQDLELLEELAETLTATAVGGKTRWSITAYLRATKRQAETALRRANYAEGIGDFPTAAAKARSAIDLAWNALDQRGDEEIPPYWISEMAYVQAMGHMRWGRALWRQGHYEQASRQLERAIPLARIAQAQAAMAADTCGPGPRSRAVEADALRNLGNVCWYLGNYEGASTYYEQALQICRETGDRRGEGASLNNMGNVATKQGNYDAAIEYYQQSLQIDREIGNRSGTGASLGNIGSAFMILGDYEPARSYLEEALQISQEISSRHGISGALNNLGIVHDQLGLFPQARSYFEQALQIRRETGERQGEAEGLSDLGLLFHHMGEDEKACEYGQKSLTIIKELGDPFIQGYILNRMGHALLSTGQLAEAAAAYQEALDLRQGLDQRQLSLESMAGLARVALVRGDLDHGQSLVEEILSDLGPNYRQAQALQGTDEPLRVYLTTYQVLQAVGSPRAENVLRVAHDLLQEQASRLHDETLRDSFLNNVPAHREIAAAFAQVEPSAN